LIVLLDLGYCDKVYGDRERYAACHECAEECEENVGVVQGSACVGVQTRPDNVD